jgi:hypothetical protein
MAENEDIPYNAPEFAIPEEEKQTDEDQPNKSVLLEVQTYLKEAIIEHNTLDVIDLTEQAKMTPTQQVAVHKVVVNHLRSVETIISNKIKELK